jgi:stringent starvation protein B
LRGEGNVAESSTKPYLIRAIHEWCSDNGFTPYIAVAVDGRTVVPREFVRNGEIVLNVSAMATHRLKLGNDLIEFQARFSGSPRELSIPVENVSAIYARENGHGMAFDVPKLAAVTAQDEAIDAPKGPRAIDDSGADDKERSPRAVPPPGGAPPRGARQLVAVPSDDAAHPTAGAAGGVPLLPMPVPISEARERAARHEPDELGERRDSLRSTTRRDASKPPEPNATRDHDDPDGPPDPSPPRGPSNNKPRQSRPRLTRVK